MTEEINIFLSLIESTIINTENPSYIEVSFQAGFIYVLVSKPEYKHYLLHERIQSIFSLIQFEHEDILERYPIIVECYDEQELGELFKSYGK